MQQEDLMIKNTDSSKEKKISFREILSILLIVSLLGTWGYIIWDKNNTRETIHEKDNLITSTSAQRDELQKELADANVRYDILKTTDAQKDSAINSKDLEIRKKQSRISLLLSKADATQAELNEARQLISALNSDIDVYKKQIAVLESKNTELTNENNSLSKKKEQLQKEYDSSIEKIKEQDNTISVGSTLHVSNFNILGLNVKGNGKEKETTTAKRVDKLRVYFDLDENMITPSGIKELYIIITDPKGKVASNNDLGSGKFTTREGDVKVFTQRMDINYTQNKSQTISFDWRDQTRFETGTYQIEVYNNGFKIGESFCALKKGSVFK